MTYDLILGDYAYSSWSLRGWLMFERFGLPRNTTMVDFKKGGVPEQMPGWTPAKTVPAMRTSEGAILGESLAIAEELASRHPEAGLWPKGAKPRAVARNLAAEMHAGFTALRGECPMNLRLAYTGVEPPEAVQADLRRLELIWDHARETCQPEGPWLCGDYSAADAFYAPVAARIAGYGLSVSPSAQAYVAAHLADPAFRRWRAMGLVHGETLNRYAKPHDLTDWPGPAPLPAKAVEAGTPENATCPYSGRPSTHLMQLGARIFGFCNAFCRDKTVADPEAWPEFMALRS
jgi:glutathione S-transferase